MQKLLTKNKEGSQENAIQGSAKRQQQVARGMNSTYELPGIMGNHSMLCCSSGVIQAKLKIGQPNDPYEQEADRVADAVMRMPDPDIQLKGRREDEDEPIQMKSNGEQTPEISPGLESQIHALKGGGEPLPKSVRDYFEPRFNQDFSRVRMHVNSNAVDAAQSIHASAFTAAPDIGFGSRMFQPQTKAGQLLIAHELTHVIQQSYRLSPETIHRYSIEGPWNKGDPVHENITLYALIIAGIVPSGTKFTADEVWEYMRGSIWNDDPEGLLFDNNEKENKNWSSGIIWYSHFNKGQKKTNKGEEIGVRDSLTARSHYGDLQFLHAMASSEKEKALQTKSKMMMWAEFTYKVAVNIIPETTLLKNTPVTGIPALFSGGILQDCSIRTLFSTHKNGSTQQRAIGSLLHLIQDSYAESHVKRTSGNSKNNGEIESFHLYGKQDTEKHHSKDVFQKGTESQSTLNQLLAIPGARTAIIDCAVILMFFKESKDWEIVKGFLNNTVFKIKDPEKIADAGAEFGKKN